MTGSDKGVDRTHLLTRADAYEEIQRLLQPGSGTITFARHADQRGIERRFSRQDIEYVLKTGVVADEPIWNESFENWKCRLTGMDIDGDELTIIIALDLSRAHIRVITAF